METLNMQNMRLQLESESIYNSHLKEEDMIEYIEMSLYLYLIYFI